MSQQQSIYFTQQGYDEMQAEQKKLQAERPLAVADLKKAREMGDLSENGYYKSARAKLSSIDSRLRHLAHVLRFAKIMQSSGSGMVDVGSTVTITDGTEEKTYTIVGEYEADSLQGKISHKSPIGSLLLNKREGEKLIVHTPGGQKVFEILSVQ